GPHRRPAGCASLVLRFGLFRDRDGSASFLHSFDRRFRRAGDLELHLARDLAFRKQPHAIELAAHEAGSDEAVLIDLILGVELAAGERGFEPAEIDPGVRSAVRLHEAALRQAPVKRRLAAFKAIDRDAVARFLALDAASGRLALA